MTNTNNVSTKKGFTMIELIFVIVIIGILAAVAIPRLAATRDDAKVAAELTTGAQLIQNLGSEYTAQGEFANYTVDDAQASTKCFKFDSNGTDAVDVSVIASTDANASDCGSATLIAEIKTRAAANGLISSDGNAKTYKFGGTGLKL